MLKLQISVRVLSPLNAFLIGLQCKTFLFENAIHTHRRNHKAKLFDCFGDMPHGKACPPNRTHWVPFGCSCFLYYAFNPWRGRGELLPSSTCFSYSSTSVVQISLFYFVYTVFDCLPGNSCSFYYLVDPSMTNTQRFKRIKMTPLYLNEFLFRERIPISGAHYSTIPYSMLFWLVSLLQLQL